MKFIFTAIISIIFIGIGFFFFSKNRNDIQIIVPVNEPRIIKGWPDGVFTSPALKETPKELKGKLDTGEWEAYTNEKMGIAFLYPAKTEGFVLNLKPHVMEENSVGPWYVMDKVTWLVTIHLVESIRTDAEGFFVISIFKKGGKFEDVVQKVREFMASGKTFTSERKVKVGDVEGIRVSVANAEKTEVSTAFILHKIGNPKNFIIDVISKRTQDPEESMEDFTERVSREEKFLDAVVSTLSLL